MINNNLKTLKLEDLIFFIDRLFLGIFWCPIHQQQELIIADSLIFS